MGRNTQSVNIPKSNIIISLGNHDVDWRIADIATNLKSDNNEQSPIVESMKHYQTIAASVGNICIKQNNFNSKGPAPFSGLIKKKNINVFVLNSGWCCSKNDLIPHGKLKQEQLNWFRDKAIELRDVDSWKILLLHHHPFSYPYPTITHDTSQLEEGKELIEIAGESGFQLVCHGHRHHPKAFNALQTNWINSITFICAGSCSVNAIYRSNGEIPNCFHILELDDPNKIVKLRNFSYRNSDGWNLITDYSKEAPLDANMCFYRPYEKEERVAALHNLIKSVDTRQHIELPQWEDLPIELRTQHYHLLNELIETHYGNNYSVYGKFPENVVLIRRQE